MRETDTQRFFLEVNKRFRKQFLFSDQVLSRIKTKLNLKKNGGVLPIFSSLTSVEKSIILGNFRRSERKKCGMWRHDKAVLRVFAFIYIFLAMILKKLKQK